MQVGYKCTDCDRVKDWQLGHVSADSIRALVWAEVMQQRWVGLREGSWEMRRGASRFLWALAWAVCREYVVLLKAGSRGSERGRRGSILSWRACSVLRRNVWTEWDAWVDRTRVIKVFDQVCSFRHRDLGRYWGVCSVWMGFFYYGWNLFIPPLFL